ncbi:MAG: hypothetical protein ICV83_25255, partial [Cytophagales bacterium]|nr:hypothetical protein [Cytophagales bacterium]
MRQQPIFPALTGRLGVLCWCLLAAWVLPAQQVTYVEYFVDVDRGFGRNTPVPVAPGANLTQSFSVPVAGLDFGFHRLYVRAKDANNHWSVTTVRSFYKEVFTQTPLPAGITRVEYFVDKDPGFGRGAAVPFSPGADLKNVSFNVSLDTLGEGFHKLYVRALNAGGQWSLASARTFYKEIFTGDPTKPANITRVEYFVDKDPGFGRGVNVPVAAAENLSDVAFNVPADTLSEGFHKLYVRALNAGGRWSLSGVRTFYKENFTIDPTKPVNITRVEYFVNDDPGFGEGTPEPVAAGE